MFSVGATTVAPAGKYFSTTSYAVSNKNIATAKRSWPASCSTCAYFVRPYLEVNPHDKA